MIPCLLPTGWINCAGASWAVSIMFPKVGVHIYRVQNCQSWCSSLPHWFHKGSRVPGADENQDLAWHWAWPLPGVVHLKVQQEGAQSPWGKVPTLQAQRTLYQILLEYNLLFLPRKIMCSLTRLASGSFSSMYKYQVIWRCVQFLT